MGESSVGGHSCGLQRLTDVDFTAVRCFGDNDAGQLNAPAGSIFADVAAGGAHSCGLAVEDGTALCWGDDADGQASPPGGVRYSAIVAGGRHTCGLRTGGKVECWGKNDAGQTAAPTARFTSLSAGDDFTCGVGMATGAAVRGGECCSWRL